MTLTLSILLIVLVVAGIGGILHLLPGVARPEVPFGVRVPQSRKDAPVIAAATRAYHRSLAATLIGNAALLVALAPLLPEGVVLTAAALLPLASWPVPFALARRMVLAAKRTESWYGQARQLTAADTSLRTEPLPYPWRWAVPAIAIALATALAAMLVYPTLPDRIPTHFGPGGATHLTDTNLTSALGIVGLQWVLVGLLLGLAAIAVRSKADLVATAAHASAEQYRRYASAMARALLVLAAGLGLTMLMVALLVWEVVPAELSWQITAVLPSLAATVALLIVAVRMGQSGHRQRISVSAEDTPAAPAEHWDDDAHWIGGLVYVNRYDPALWVPKRFGGVGWTVNMARPTAWVMLAALLALMIGLPVWAVSRSADDDDLPEDAAPIESAPLSPPTQDDLSMIDGTPVAGHLP